jgi:hypothetical protein
MKKLMETLAVVAFVVLLSGCWTLSSVPSGQEAEYGRIETDNDLIQFLAFSDDPNTCAMAIQDKQSQYPARYALVLDGPAREAMRAALAKYESWKGLAQENQTAITKTITKLELQQMYYQREGWRDAGDREISLLFASSIDDNGNQSFSLELKSYVWRGFYRGYGRDSLLLSDDQAITFSDLLSEDALKDGYQKAKKKQDVINQFN